MAVVHRAAGNPVLTPAMVRPTRSDVDVVGVFNPAAIQFGGETLLLVRVAEAPRKVSGQVAALVFDASSGEQVTRRWALDAPGLDVSDARLIVSDGRTWLTSLSHLRVARSTDGLRFTVDDAPALAPATALEAFGVEDARITLLDGTYWVNYTAVSGAGIATALASTTDFRTFTRHGIIFPPDNRDVTRWEEPSDWTRSRRGR